LEGSAVIVAATTLLIGFVIGYLGQRSRLCFIGGIRDFILVRDTDLLKGLLAFAATAWLLFPVARLLTGAPQDLLPADAIGTVLTLAGAAGVGYVSTLANGCPFRQHVLAAQGVASSIAYVIGFLAGAVVFHVWTAQLILRLVP
jgi:uncharacterized membrane protein YedE/YeeE